MTRVLGGLLVLSLLWHWWTWSALTELRVTAKKDAARMVDAMVSGARARLDLEECQADLSAKTRTVDSLKSELSDAEDDVAKCKRRPVARAPTEQEVFPRSTLLDPRGFRYREPL